MLVELKPVSVVVVVVAVGDTFVELRLGYSEASYVGIVDDDDSVDRSYVVVAVLVVSYRLLVYLIAVVVGIERMGLDDGL